MDILGQRLRKVRRAQDLTQHDLEKLSGVHYTTISRLESGEPHKAYAATVRDLAEALDVSMDYLMGLRQEEAPG